MSFADRTAIVAGGSTGIGLAAALRLLQGGARVVICSHEEVALAPALAQLEGQGGALARTRSGGSPARPRAPR